MAGANPFALKSKRLLEIAGLIYKHFPTCKTIGCFARVTDVTSKTDEELAALPRGTVVVNLFAGGPDTEVRMQLDEGPWQTLTRAKIPAPSVLRSRQRQRLGLRKPLQAHPSPHRVTPSPHVWIGQLPADTAPGAHTLRLEARDTTSDAAVRISDTRVIVTGD